jgi:hypothetical protein
VLLEHLWLIGVREKRMVHGFGQACPALLRRAKVVRSERDLDGNRRGSLLKIMQGWRGE